MKNIFLKITLLLYSSLTFSQSSSQINSINELTDSIASIVDQQKITGLMLGICTKDSILFSGGFGYANLAEERKVDNNTLFRMGSITKMFVSLGIMNLVDQGKLNLDDNLKDIAPEVPFKNDWSSVHPIKIVHLLEHTTGFDDVKLNTMYSLETNENAGAEMMLVYENSMVSRWIPGERFAYSNPNYAILGFVIEKITGKPYDQYLKEIILNPLAMASSNFNLRSKFPERDVNEYIIEDGTTKRVESVTLLSGPQGALWSSSNDMVKFLQLYLQKGAPIFNQNIISEIETTHSTLDAKIGQLNGYALANDNTFYSYKKYPYRGHQGLTGTCYSSFLYNRDINIGFVIASNCNNNNNLIADLIVSYFEHDLPIKKLDTYPLDIKIVTPFLGRYQFDSPRHKISAFVDKLKDAPEIYIENEKLYFKQINGSPFELVQTSHLTFTWTDRNIPLISFTQNSEGENVMMIAGSYYEQTSNFWALTKRIIIAIAILIILSSYILAIISLIRVFRKKMKLDKLLPRTMHAIGLTFLIITIINIQEIEEFTYQMSELGNINFRTLSIFIGTSLFGITSVIGILLPLKKLRGTTYNFINIYMMALSISSFLIMLLLFQNGWIGLRTWAL